MPTADPVTHMLFGKVAICVLDEDHDLFSNFRKCCTDGFDSPFVECRKRSIHNQRIWFRRQQLVIFISGIPIVSRHLDNARNKGKNHRDTLSGRSLYISMIIVGIDGDMILVIDRQGKTTFVNLLKDFINGVLQPRPNLIFTLIIELNKFPINPLSISFVDLGLFVALIEKGELSATSICPFFTALRIATVTNTLVTLFLATADCFVALLDLRINCSDFRPHIVTAEFLLNSMQVFRKIDNLIFLLADDT